MKFALLTVDVLSFLCVLPLTGAPRSELTLEYSCETRRRGNPQHLEEAGTLLRSRILPE